MKNVTVLIILFFCWFGDTTAQNKFSISGSINDAENGEDLIGVRVTIQEFPNIGVTTNLYGFYSITLPEGNYHLILDYIGYKREIIPIELNQNIRINKELNSLEEILNEVIVSAVKADENVTSTEMSVVTLDIAKIKTLPVLFGEQDVLKTIALLPGVNSAGEGNSGFFVRGGSADQNLILLDGAPVYNASHLLGFFSVFNSDALSSVKLYKGAIPAEYGGRLSSVLTVKMKEGNSKKLAVNGGIGLISSRLTIEAPIAKQKGSFIVSGRRTYADVFLKLSPDTTINRTTLYFFDLNGKVNYRFNDKDRLFVSGYLGRDRFGATEFGFNWGNSTATVRWNHIFNNKLFTNTSLIYSNFDYEIVLPNFDGNKDAKLLSHISDINLKQDYEYFVNNKNTTKFGFNIIQHTFKPGESIGIKNIPNIENKYSFESSLYVSNEQKISSRITANYGLRFSNFTQLGPGNIYTFQNGELTDTTKYSTGERVVQYNYFAPRIAINLKTGITSSTKVSYSRTNQFLHFISNTTASTPTDIWLPSSNNLKPQLADQIALGWFKNFKENQFEFSVEAYYKDFKNVVDYKVGAQTTFNPIIEGELIIGKGRAYGLEVYLNKKLGRFTGWFSYTLSRTERKIEGVNSFNWYPSKQDRTHDISITGIYDINERYNLSAAWVYYTGNATTFPSSYYEIENRTYFQYTDRNGGRFPNYHRFDVSFTIKNKPFKTKQNKEGVEHQVKKKFSSSWNFSVYNIYARQNAYFIQIIDDPNTRFNRNVKDTKQAQQTSLFRIIPSVTYNFNF